MLNIIFNEASRDIAEKMERDLQSSPIQFTESYAIVIVTSASRTDAEVMQAVEAYRAKGHRLIACVLEDVVLPEYLQGGLVVDMRGGYRGRKLSATLRRLEVGEERIGRNNLLLGLIAGLAFIVFVVAIFGITSGQVVFPVAEYATENAANQALIDGFLRPTLEAFQPRSTQDALNFPATLEAVSTRAEPYLAMTATALPRSIEGTLEAIETSAGATMTAQAAD